MERPRICRNEVQTLPHCSLKAMTGWPNALVAKQTSGRRSHLRSKNHSPIVWSFCQAMQNAENIQLRKLPCSTCPSCEKRLDTPSLWLVYGSMALWPTRDLRMNLWTVQLSHWKQSRPCRHVPRSYSLSSLGSESQIWHLGSPTRTERQQLDWWSTKNDCTRALAN